MDKFDANSMGQTDSIGSPLFYSDAPPVPIPPEKRKIDPKTIQWPEGVPKPWEKKQKPPSDDTGGTDGSKK